MYFDGCAGIFCNGEIVAMTSQFSLKDVEVVTANLDLEDVRSFRTSASRSAQGAQADIYERIEVPMSLSRKADALDPHLRPSPAIEAKYLEPEAEIALGPACWLWDYLRRSSINGFFLPLSGGLDSASTATITYSMCRLVVDEAKGGNKQVIKDLRRIAGEPEDSTWLPATPQEFCGRIFYTCYMGTTNSSSDTRNRAKQLAKDIGAVHTDLNMDSVVSAMTGLFTLVTGFKPQYAVHGGSAAENLALQSKRQLCLS
jgi:NAD+ synthase (glutamine-hydrolysing)